MVYGKTTISGHSIYLSEGYLPAEPGANGLAWKVGKFGLLAADLEQMQARGEWNKIAWLQELALPGLSLTRHVFCGLKRPLLTDGNKHADKTFLVHSRKPSFDVQPVASQPGRVEIERVWVPPRSVFVVITAPNIKHKPSYPQIDGWIDHWGWIDEDPGLDEAPANWVDRYERKLFTVANADRIGNV